MNKEHADIFMGRVVEYRPDTTTYTNRTSFGFEGEHATEGRDFDGPKVACLLCWGWGSIDVYGIRCYLTILMFMGLDEAD